MMNRILLSITIFITCFGFSQTIEIQEAIDNNKIEYSITGSWDYNDPKEYLDSDGQYFGKCMTITIRNKYNDTIPLSIPNGLLLMCDDTTVQDMLITKPMFVYLFPRQKKTFQLYAMCSEIHDAMPGKQKKYKVGKMANGDLVRIAYKIDEMFMHNIVGQGAVWACSDNATENDLRTYGATDASLKLTIELLDQAQVKTKLNPPINEPVKVDSIKPKDKASNKNLISKNQGLTIEWLYVYLISGLFLILLIYSAYLTIQKRRKSNIS